MKIILQESNYTFDASAQTITFAGLGTVELKDIYSIINAIDNTTIYGITNPAKGVTSFTANVLTLVFDTTSMADADKLTIIYEDGNPAIDTTLAIEKVIEQAPAYKQNYVETVLDLTDTAVATIRTIIDWTDVRSGSIHLNCTGGVTFTLWASNNSAADNSADTNWIDVSTLILGAASIVDNAVFKPINPDILMPDRFMLKYVTSDTTNTVQCFVKRAN